jgi:hypothetical protein
MRKLGPRRRMYVLLTNSLIGCEKNTGKDISWSINSFYRKGLKLQGLVNGRRKTYPSVSRMNVDRLADAESA